MSNRSIKNYRETQKKIDERVLYEESKKNTQPPWIVISHDGQELLIDMLKEVLRIEVAKVLKDMFSNLQLYDPTEQAQGPPDRMELIRNFLTTRKYPNNSFVWNRNLDLELIEKCLRTMYLGGKFKEVNIEFSKKHGMSVRGIEQRWSKLLQELKGAGIVT